MAHAICSVSGCPKPTRVRGWCSQHYERWRAHGDPLATVRNMEPTLAARLAAKVDRSGGPDACWPFTGSIDSSGYGNFAFKGRKMRGHRAAYQVAKGSIPPGLFVCHSCDFRPCCNPAHLWLGTAADNNADMRAKGRGYLVRRGGRNS